MTGFDRHPRLRWAVPAALVSLIVAGAVIGPAVASADAGLPPITAQQLLVDLQAAQATPVSGTVEASADLGLPELPGSMSNDTGPTALLSGTHTVRVWSDGRDKSRIALLGRSAEYDVVRNGLDAWIYSSSDQSAEHVTLPPHEGIDATGTLPDGLDLPPTPQDAAQRLLTAAAESTDVTTSGVDRVAGRDVYELILTPKSSDTLVARAVIAIDAETKVPVRVQVFSTAMAEPAYEVGFTSVDFGPIDGSLFAFTPPPGTDVTERTLASAMPTVPAVPDLPKPTVVGTGWDTVMIVPIPADALANLDSSNRDVAQLASVLQSLPMTSGPWGTATVLEGTLFSVIATADGRLAVGAVPPAVLGDALAAS